MKGFLCNSNIPKYLFSLSLLILPSPPSPPSLIDLRILSPFLIEFIQQLLSWNLYFQSN